MINVTPEDYRQSLRYARHNTVLATWLTRVVVLFIVIVFIILSGTWYFRQETTRYSKNNQILEQQLKDNHLEETLKTVSNISSNLKLIVQVLSGQVLFSKLIKQVGAVMPENAVLSDIEISKVEGGIDLTADAKDQNTATQVQVNLAATENKLFEKVDIISINCDENVNKTYPCKVSLRALFTKNNPFTFSSQSKGATQ